MAWIEKINAEFEALNKTTEAAPLAAVRSHAFKAFESLGIPTTRHEEWRYTNIKTKLPETLSLTGTATNSLPAQHSFHPINGHRLVFVNGQYNQQLSVIHPQAGLTVTTLKQALHTHAALVKQYYGQLSKTDNGHFTNLNTAFATDGPVVIVEKNTCADLPVVIEYLNYNNPDNFVQSRLLCIAAENSSVKLVEDFQNIGGQPAFGNFVSEYFLANGAAVQVTQLQTETYGSTSVYTTEAELQSNARFNCNCIALEGTLIRNNTNARLVGPNAEANLYGLYYGKGQSLIDNHILVDHISAHCQSNQLYKGILDDEATGVFNGKIFVKPDAQKTNAFQSSKVLLLSDTAAINSKPQLEIFADDVKCSHGAAIGQMNKNELFYLKARGIDEAQAKALLTYAFAAEVIAKIEVEELRTFVDEKLKDRLNISI